ncbi:HEAT repeat domain-containing protein [Calothrix sp. 336/3]|uniref:HEAT repeat domain-containing protein n=1 Tax=Calothrix sp. 336/3 TaxID=1337936 RepID=UPI001439E226|nr:HEAT repeat domain-containing protein [Calothrix sp. 336/3]
MIDWRAYLESICQKYAEWQESYTITDVVGKNRDQEIAKVKSLLFDLQASLCQPETQKPEREAFLESRNEREILNILEGLRKYAPKHVLLIGRPGSGKSTALKRLLLELAEGLGNTGDKEDKSVIAIATQQNQAISPTTENQTNPVIASAAKRKEAISSPTGETRIPVLVELRYYETSTIDLITAFLHSHHPTLPIDSETVKQLLRQGNFFLLIDGVNELPSPEAQRNLQKFHQDYQQTTPMIFTTRDLGVGGDLGIDNKLEMQPLTETQMGEFVRGYLGETGEAMLQQLGGRLREFGETPLLLMMLCLVFASNGNQIPPNLGSVFRVFTDAYSRDTRLKGGVQVYEDYQDWCFNLLRELAFKMMQSSSSTDFRLSINREEAEDILCEYLQEEKFNQPRVYAKRWLNDLLKCHLIQIVAGDKIEFRHQLIQEYYAAEKLWSLVKKKKLTDDELQWDYLNYLKWTEPTALMLGLVDDEVLALRVVRLALQVDWQFGARLAGEVRVEWQEKSVGFVESLNIPVLLKAKLLGKTKSEEAIPFLMRFFEHEYSIPEDDESYHPHFHITFALREIKSKATIDTLIKLLKHDDVCVRDEAVIALGEIKAEASVYELIKLIEDEEQLVRWSTSKALREIQSQSVVCQLIKLLSHQDLSICKNAISALRIIKSQEAISHLLNLLETQDISICRYAMAALLVIDLEGMIPRLPQLLEHEYPSVCEIAVKAVGAVKLEKVIPKLIQFLEHENLDIRISAINALGKIQSEEAIPRLINFLEDKNIDIRESSIKSLIEIKIEVVVSVLLKLLEHKNFDIRISAINSLGNIRSEEPIPRLIQFLEHENVDIRESATKTLIKIQSETTVIRLIELLEHENLDIVKNSIKTLGKLKAVEAISNLCQLLNHEDLNIRKIAKYALNEMPPEAFINNILVYDLYNGSCFAKDINNYTSDLKNIQFNLDDYLWNNQIGSDYDEPNFIDESEVIYPRDDYPEKRFSENRIRDLIKQSYSQEMDGLYALHAMEILEEIQQHLKYYKPQPNRTMSNILSHNYALLIGVGECAYPDWSLPTTVKDIRAVKTLLTDEKLCGYIDNNQHLRLLSNQTATSANILEGLNWLKQQAENDPEATIFIYYSGHGWLDKSTNQYYLIPHDTKPHKLTKTALPAENFNTALQQIPAKQLLVIIDSCHAQGMASSKDEPQDSDLPDNFVESALPKNIIDELKQGAGKVVFTSSTGNQSSWIRPDGKMSVYTYHLLEALQGAANQAGDKVVKVSHLMNYLSKTVPATARELCKAEQTPFFSFETEDFPVALLCGGKGLATAGYDKQQTEETIRGIVNNLTVSNSDVGTMVTIIGNNASVGDISSNKGK